MILITGTTLSGRNDMLEVAQFMAHVGGFGWEPEKVLPMVTSVPARVLSLQNYGFKRE